MNCSWCWLICCKGGRWGLKRGRNRAGGREGGVQRYLQELWVLLAQLLEQGRQQSRVLLDHLSHVLELGLLPQELQWIFPYGRKPSLTKPP